MSILFVSEGEFSMAMSFGLFCTVTTKLTPNPEGGQPVPVYIAVCIKLDGLFQNTNGLCEALGLTTLDAVRTADPRPIIEIERFYSSAARRGVFGKMGFEMRVRDGNQPDPGFGNSYKSMVVYSLELSAAEVAQTV